VGVIIGMDPHKRSATIEVLDDRAKVLAAGRYGTDKAGYARGRPEVRRPGLGGRGLQRGWQHIAHRLVASGETVLDVPAKLSAQVRVFATGNGRKTDPVDAHSVALAALRSPKLVQVEVSPDLVVLGMLADRRDELGRARTQTLNRIRRLLLELIPGGKQFLSAAQARGLLATTRPRDIVGKTRRRLAAELITELDGIDRKIKASKKEITVLVEARGSTLLQLQGIGPSSAARLLAAVGNIHRFASRDHFASWNGTAPLDASSGQQLRHRLSAPATGGSTGPCTSWPSSSYATRPKDAPTTTPAKQPGKPRWKPCGASNDACPTWSAGRCSTTRTTGRRRAREGTRGRH
jgi:transposase